MTAAGVIAPVVPPPPGAGRTVARDGVVSLVRKPLPLPDLPPQRTSAVIYGASAVDDRGRVVDRVVLRALGWRAGHRLNIHEAAGMLTVVPDSAGDHQVTGQGHLRIPAALRHRCGLITGDRVLLAADPDRSRLAIYPPPPQPWTGPWFSLPLDPAVTPNDPAHHPGRGDRDRDRTSYLPV